MSGTIGRQSEEVSPDLAEASASSDIGIMAASAAALVIGGSVVIAMRRIRRGTTTRQD
ncbi:hypothetical protein OG883_32740 [Streptomyces sp. NBC_01142]|uniref:hypothetical protein n=1 Tax=Streptomyces sp. NBC_01142 TaxID=2975865 RepID=UPI0022530995|nr:hypothetical protein [Streptomyces sp. NBC_01142]MCX4824543.1 hypothetical protein [Streptomyces sp. NBC_01142]